MPTKILLTVFTLVFSLKAAAQYPFSFRGKCVSSIKTGVLTVTIEHPNPAEKPLSVAKTDLMNGSFNITGVLQYPAARIRLLVVSAGRQYRSGCILDSGKNEFNFNGFNTRNGTFDVTTGRSESNRLRRLIDSLKTARYRAFGQKNSEGSATTLDGAQRQALNQEILKTIESHPGSFYSLLALYQLGLTVYMAGSETRLLETLAKLDASSQKSSLGKELLRSKTAVLEARLRTAKGSPVPKFSIESSDGSRFDNRMLQGKPYLVVFSATWCVPCQADLPEVKSLFNRLRAKNFEVIYFNLDDDEAKWKAHIVKNKLDWINVSEKTKFRNSPIAHQFDVKAIPAYFFISRNGEIVYTKEDEEKMGVKAFFRKIEQSVLDQ